MDGESLLCKLRKLLLRIRMFQFSSDSAYDSDIVCDLVKTTLSELEAEAEG